MIDPISQTFSALADPTRRAILSRLRESPATINELAAPFEMSLPAISRHIKILERAKLLTRTKEAQFRRCDLNPIGLVDATDWLDRHREFWDRQLDALAHYLEDHPAPGNHEKHR